MIQQTKTGSGSGVSNQRPALSWKAIIKDCLLFVALAVLVGGLLSYPVLANAFNGTLVPTIQQNQLDSLKTKSLQIYSGISFIDLVPAKTLYDEKIAIFLDARSLQEYQIGHIAGAISMPPRELLKGITDPDKLLPDKATVLIAYCDGGECELSLDIARELSGRGYQNIFILGDGYPGWAAAGYPTDK